MSEIGLAFVYRNAEGVTSDRRMERWSESGHYIEGYELNAGKFCTFRKDRVVTYLDGCAQLLRDPFAPPPPKLERTRPVQVDERPQILFTGFAAVQRAHLEHLCGEAGMRVVKTVTQGLTFMCAGSNAGPAKVAKARGQHVYIVKEPELHALLATGELPDYAIDDLL